MVVEVAVADVTDVTVVIVFNVAVVVVVAMIVVVVAMIVVAAAVIIIVVVVVAVIVVAVLFLWHPANPLVIWRCFPPTNKRVLEDCLIHKISKISTVYFRVSTWSCQRRRVCLEVVHGNLTFLKSQTAWLKPPSHSNKSSTGRALWVYQLERAITPWTGNTGHRTNIGNHTQIYSAHLSMSEKIDWFILMRVCITPSVCHPATGKYNQNTTMPNMLGFLIPTRYCKPGRT